MPPQTGQSRSGEREREGARHDELPVGEVDEAQHAEDEADADRHQRVDRADPDRVHLHLGVDGRAQEVGEPAGGGRSREVRLDHPLGVAGVVGRQGQPHLAVRQHQRAIRERDGRWARCSTRRIAIPSSRIVSSASKTRSITFGERPSDGSSSRSTAGAATSARAMASCCCCPPERTPACGRGTRRRRETSR